MSAKQIGFLSFLNDLCTEIKKWCKMKQLITLSIILSSAFHAYAQDANKSVTLNEVTVKAAKVVNKRRWRDHLSYRCAETSFEQWL